MVRDFALRTANNGTFDVTWVFSPEALLRSNATDAVLDFSAENISRVKGVIADEIVRLMRDNPAIKEATQKALDLTDLTDRQWRNFLLDGLDNNRSFRQELFDDFIEIDTYSNVRSFLEI